MAKDTSKDVEGQDQEKEDDGRLVATTAFSVDNVSYQKGEYVETGSLEEEELGWYIEQGILWTETQWVGKYKTEPTEHEEKNTFPRPQGTMTTAQGATAVQDTNPALRREGDTRVETTTSGQTPTERAAATGSGAESSGSSGPAADARKTSSTSTTTKK